MQTYDDLFLIENRADPRRRMFYIVPPFTSMLDDPGYMGAEMAVATQKNLNMQNSIDQGVARMNLRLEGRKDTPELGTGAITTYLT